MRIGLMTALMVVAAMASADAPSTPASAKEAAPATSEAAAQPADTSATQVNGDQATAAAKVEEDKPFKPPAGYRAKRVDGQQVYCTKIVVLGSRFPKEDCRTEAQLRELELRKQEMRGDMEQRNRVCAGGGACQNF
jgi:hypothetical protein